MAKLHEIKHYLGNLLKKDCNLRNFIFSDKTIYGLDFDEIGYGDSREDLGDICFFLLTNFPSYTEEKKSYLKDS
ncbi:MAG: hypothetical protein ACXVHW_04940 [Methanobacterium sp.]